MAINSFCQICILNCYNCAQTIPNLEAQGLIILKDKFDSQVLLCGDSCKKEFDIDNKGKIININKVFRLIEGGLSPFRETYYCSSRRLKVAKKQLEKQNVNIVFQSSQKYHEDNFGSRYEDDLDSTCYDEKRRMICAYCRKLLDLDDDELRKELWGGKPDAKSFIMADGCTVLMYCDVDCVDKSF
jgi:hypothetical protein